MEQTLKTTWVSDGVTHTVTTVKKEGETPDQFLDRHIAAVELMQAQYPPG